MIFPAFTLYTTFG